MSYLGWHPVKVLAQHSPHVFARVRRHLVFKQEGEVASLADAVEVAVDLVVLTPCQERRGINDPTAESFIFGRFGECAQHELVASTRRRYEKQSGLLLLFFFCNKRGLGFLGVLDCTCGRNIRSVQCHTEPVRLPDLWSSFITLTCFIQLGIYINKFSFSVGQ